MHDASDGAITASMGYFHSGHYKIGGQEVYVSRTGWTGELGYEIYAQWDRIDCNRLWKHLMNVGEPHGMVFEQSWLNGNPSHRSWHSGQRQRHGSDP